MIYGGAGNDVAYGAAQNDSIDGDAGADTLFGGEGDDTLNGGTGDDVLYGGAGSDVLVFEASHGNDSVGGFEANGDNTIDLSALNLSGYDALTINPVGNGVLVETGEGSITLWGVSVDQITADDFIF